MKTRYIFALCALAAAFSCSKNTTYITPAPEEGEITIRATLPAETKGASPRTGISWAWNAGDKISVSGETKQVFTIKDGFTPKMAEFTGKAVEGESFTILYPADAASLAWASQTQVGNNSLEHLVYTAALSDVDNYTEFAFSPEWAQEHGGALAQSGVLKMILALPASITAPSSITIKAESPIFHADNAETMTDKLELAITGVTLEPGEKLTAWMTTSWAPVEVPSGTVLTIVVKAGTASFEKEIEFTKDASLLCGTVNTFTVGADGWVASSNYTSGKGTKELPWIITTADQMLCIADDLAAGATRYFKLGADIDMAGKEWTPLNTASPYGMAIDFDGDGHTITNLSVTSGTYSSLFGVLNGRVANLNITNASVTSTGGSAVGIVAGYGGTDSIHSEIVNVHAQGEVLQNGGYRGTGGLVGRLYGPADNPTVISRCSFSGSVTMTATNTGTGGLVGVAKNALISACSTSATVTNVGNYAGGIMGFDDGTVTIENCYSAGSVAGNQRIGGLVGGLIKAQSAIRNCYSTASLSASVCLGGILGHASLDKWTATTSEPGNVVEKCIAWNTSIRATGEQQDEYTDQGSSGAIVGYTSVKNYLTDCFRRADLDFAEKWKGNVLYDQENASPTTPLVETVVQQYNYPYHGKAAAADASVSSVAQSLGWDAAVWDFSEDLPKLR